MANKNRVTTDQITYYDILEELKVFDFYEYIQRTNREFQTRKIINQYKTVIFKGCLKANNTRNYYVKKDQFSNIFIMYKFGKKGTCNHTFSFVNRLAHIEESFFKFRRIKKNSWDHLKLRREIIYLKEHNYYNWIIDYDIIPPNISSPTILIKQNIYCMYCCNHSSYGEYKNKEEDLHSYVKRTDVKSWQTIVNTIKLFMCVKLVLPLELWQNIFHNGYFCSKCNKLNYSNNYIGLTFKGEKPFFIKIN